MKKRNIILLIIVAVSTVMIHFGGRRIYKAYDVQNDKYVYVNINQYENLYQEFRSPHTSAVSRVFFYMCGDNGGYEDIPKAEIGNLNGDLPISYYSDLKREYSYANKDGEVVIEDGHGVDFEDIGIVDLGYQVMNTKGEDLIEYLPEPNGNDYDRGPTKKIVDRDNMVILYYYECFDKKNSGSSEYVYVMTDFDGKKVKLSEEEFCECVTLPDKVKELKAKYGFTED